MSVPPLRHTGPMLMAAALVGGVFAAAAAVTVAPASVAAVALLPVLAAGVFLLRRPDWIFWLMVLTAPFKDHLGVAVGGANVRAYNALALAGVAWLFCRLFSGQRTAALEVLKRGQSMFVPLVLLVVSKLVTVGLLHDLPPSMTRSFPVKYVVFYVTLFATAAVVFFMTSSRDRLRTALRGWLHVSNVIIVVALLQIILSNVFHFHYVHHREVIFFGRPYSVFREPDVLGSFVAASVLILLPQVIFPKSALFGRRYLWGTLAAHGVFLLILFVRAAWVATAGCLMVMTVAANMAGFGGRVAAYARKLVAGALLAVVLLPILAPSFTETLAGRFASLGSPTEESASAYRMNELTAMADATLGADLETMLFGHGDFAWTYWAPHLLGESFDRNAIEAMQAGGDFFVHAGFCMALTTLFDNGVVGLVLMVWFVVGLCVAYVRAVRAFRRPDDHALLQMTFLPIICVLICFQFSYDAITPFLWVQIGLFMAAQDIIRNERERRAEG